MGIERRPNRRSVLGMFNALGTASVVGALGAGGVLGAGELLKPHHEKHERPGRETFELAEIAGLHNGGLAQWYLGTKEKHFPESLEISYTENLAQMWAEKLRRMGSAAEEATNSVTAFADERTAEYSDLWKQGEEAIGIPTVPEGLSEHPYFTRLVIEFSRVETEALKDFDWGGLAEGYGFKEDWYVDMLAHLASRAHGLSLAAYSMTEIMPYGKGNSADNIPLYNFLLRTAGPSFVTRIPAMSDGLISYGPFQFTKWAIDRGIARPNDPTAVNQYLPARLQVPNTIRGFAEVEEDQKLATHARAALLFGLQNVAIATKELSNRGSGPGALEAISNMDGGTFASVLAMHHYRPTDAKRALIEWAEASARGEQPKPCDTFALPEVGHYGERSESNYKAVDAYIKAIPKT